MTALWVALVVSLLVMLAVFAVLLFRKVIGVLQEFSDLVGRTAILDGVHRADTEQRPVPAVLGGIAEPRAAWRELRHRGRERGAERRLARVQRARDLIRADATSIEWFQR